MALADKHLPVRYLAALSCALVLGCFSARPADRSEPESVSEASAAVWSKPILALIRQHRERGTLYDGPRCPLYPSCAAYGEQAIERYGLVGFLLTIERLFFREFGNLEGRYRPASRLQSSDLRYQDPLSDALPWTSPPGPSLLTESRAPN
ncbi:MAG: membrane protein insertion efficiency factor YidD [Leptospirales bacterium]|nr:membrane protein insertion efficiency factor YidD [Leptospirales bacterium]